MEIKKVSIFSKDYSAYKTLQKRAFPKEEQYPFWILLLMAMQKDVDYLAYHDLDYFCGISYTSCTDQMLYILYLAVNDEIRSRGYGTRILDIMKKKYPGKNITLNVEPLDKHAKNYEQRIKRMEFYYRNGFHDTGYRLIDTTGEYTILSTTENFSVEDYQKAIRKIGMNVFRPVVK